jgi:hypothetical protein
MPGYEPFLLCDFHIHTRWSDGRLALREVVDLYGETGKFDVIAITDHILMKKDLLARLGGVATLGRRNFGLREETFDDYLAEIRSEASRALRKYGMLVIPGAAVTRHCSRYQAIHQRRSASDRRTAGSQAAGCAEYRLSPASPDDATDRDQYLLSVGPSAGAVRFGRRLGSGKSRRPLLSDEPEALSLCRQQRLSQAETSAFVEDASEV